MIDYTGIPSSQCPNCNSRKFVTWIMIDPEDYEIGIYGTDGTCAASRPYRNGTGRRGNRR
jgi:hypothetical protein